MIDNSNELQENITKEENNIQENNQKKYFKKSFHKKIRISLIIIGAVIFISGCIGIYISSRPYEEEKSNTLLSFKTVIDSSYRVHTIKNEFFSEWLEEGRIYSEKLTDFIEIEFKSETALTKKSNISGNYNISAVIEGYQIKSDTRIPIYERKYPLKNNIIDNYESTNFNIIEKINISIEKYKKYAIDIESILGGSTTKDLYILFEGKYTIDTKEKDFSYRINIPIKDDIFYEILKSEPTIIEDSIEEKTNVTVNPNINEYYHFVVLCIIGLLLIIITNLFTKNFNDKELWKYELSKILRKYGSRMICVENLPNSNSKEILKLTDILSMISMSEELKEPILYSLDENGLAHEGKFYIFADKYTYLLEYKEPTTLV